MVKRNLLLALVLVLLLSAFLPAITAHHVPNPWHCVVATIGEPDTVDPAWLYDTASAELAMNVYDTLIFFDVDRTCPPEEQGRTDVFVPSIATEWSFETISETSPEGLAWVQRWYFTIRTGVQLHDDSTLTSGDVEYSFERWMVQCRSGGPTWMILEPTLGVHKIRPDYPDPDAIVNGKMIDHAIESNATHVWFNLVMPYPPFLAIIAQSWASIVPKAWAVAPPRNDWPGEFGHEPGATANWTDYNNPTVSPLDTIDTSPPGPHIDAMCGTGPFKFDYWIKGWGGEWSIVRNVNYWRDWPAPGCGGGYPQGWIERVTVKSISEWRLRKEMFLSGDADFCFVPRDSIPELITNWPPGSPVGPQWYGIPEEYVPGIRCFKDLPLLACSPVMFFNFDINSTSPYMGVPGGLPLGTFSETGIPPDFFNDIDIRKGFAYAFNYTEYIRDVYKGEAGYCPTCVIKGLPYHNPEQERYYFNLTAAEEHFIGAWGGQVWTEGFTMTIAVNVGSTPRGTYIDILKATIESLNPKFHIEKVEVSWPTFLEQLVHKELPIFLIGWLADYPDPHDFVYPFMHAEEGDFACFQNIQYGQSGHKQIVYHANGVPYGNPALVINNTYVNQMIQHGIMTLNHTERQAIYYELQAIYHDEAPSVPLCGTLVRNWQRDWMMGWYYNPTYPGKYFYHYWKGYTGDINKDYVVDIYDLVEIGVVYGETGPPGWIPEDLNKDGVIDIYDLVTVGSQYGC